MYALKAIYVLLLFNNHQQIKEISSFDQDDQIGIIKEVCILMFKICKLKNRMLIIENMKD